MVVYVVVVVRPRRWQGQQPQLLERADVLQCAVLAILVQEPMWLELSEQWKALEWAVLAVVVVRPDDVVLCCSLPNHTPDRLILLTNVVSRASELHLSPEASWFGAPVVQ